MRAYNLDTNTEFHYEHSNVKIAIAHAYIEARRDNNSVIPTMREMCHKLSVCGMIKTGENGYHFASISIPFKSIEGDHQFNTPAIYL